MTHLLLENLLHKNTIGPIYQNYQIRNLTSLPIASNKSSPLISETVQIKVALWLVTMGNKWGILNVFYSLEAYNKNKGLCTGPYYGCHLYSRNRATMEEHEPFTIPLYASHFRHLFFLSYPVWTRVPSDAVCTEVFSYIYAHSPPYGSALSLYVFIVQELYMLHDSVHEP